MGHMLDTLKVKLSAMITKWTKDVDSSVEGRTVIDITKEFERVFAKNIIHIAFGEDINDETLEFMMRQDLQGKKPLKKEQVKLNVAIQEGFEQALMTMRFKIVNPLFWMNLPSPAFTQVEVDIKENCTRLREHIRKYVHKRKSGQRASSIGEKADLLTLFFSVPDVFTEELIIDELMDFFSAAS